MRKYVLMELALSVQFVMQFGKFDRIYRVDTLKSIWQISVTDVRYIWIYKNI